MRILGAVLFCLFTLLSVGAQEKEVRNFIFGHSLIDHRPPAIPTPSNETTVPHWIFLLAEDAGHSYAAGGKYGFLPQHADLPPFSQWGYDLVPGVWDSDYETFSEADINKVLITVGNFMQWQSPDEDYFGEEGISPFSASRDIADWLHIQEDSIDIYIYENWPDMAGFIADESFPPSEIEFSNYNKSTIGEFHDWWIDYHDLMLESRPDFKIRMIPVGPVIVKLLEDHLSAIPIEELYEDNAPHGRPNIYFLAALTTYMAMYGEKAPASYEVPELLSPIIKDTYSLLVDDIWDYLIAFNDENGQNRVFFGSETISSIQSPQTSSEGIVFPNPSNGVLNINDHIEFKKLEIFDVLGNKVVEFKKTSTHSSNFSFMNTGTYIVRVHLDDNQIIAERLVVVNK